MVTSPAKQRASGPRIETLTPLGPARIWRRPEQIAIEAFDEECAGS